MELKPKYQYTYFIKPFYIEGEKYESYLINILKNKKMSLKIWEKEKDFEVYSYFEPELRDKIFASFQYSKEKISKLEKTDEFTLAKILRKQPCVHFTYMLEEDTPGKIGEENGIFFGVRNIDVVCFNTGICFILIKTYIEDLKSFSDVLNFNYKFRDISSKYANLKEYERINIQTSNFHTNQELSDFIRKITGVSEKKQDSKYYVYAYTCLDGESWNDKVKFEDIQTEFYKYREILPSNYNVDWSAKKSDNTIDKWEYARFGFSKNASVLLTSNLNAYHYTKLPFEYENQYLYTFLLALYERLYLKKLNKELKSNNNIKKIKSNFQNFMKVLWSQEITEDEMGTMFYNKLRECFELDNLYLETLNAYDWAYKEKNTNKTKRNNCILWGTIGICLVLNIINLIVLIMLQK